MDALLVAAGLLLAAPEVAPQVLVLVQGNGADAGAAQRAIEAALQDRGVIVRSTADVATTIGAAEPAPTPVAPSVAEAGQRIAIAVEAFFEGEFRAARDSALRAKQLAADAPESEERVVASLWLAAILARSDDSAGAEKELADLLSTVDPSPALPPDLPPDFGGLLERARARVPAHEVKLTEMPLNARIFLNGRKVASNPFRVAQGRPARIAVRATGYQTAELTLTVTRPETRSVPLAIAPGAKWEGAIRAALSGKTDERVAAALRDLAAAARVNGLVLVQAPDGKSGSRALLWRNSGFTALRATSPSEVADSAVLAYRPARTPASLAANAGLGMAIAFWRRDLGTGLQRYALMGAGPRAFAGASWRRMLAQAEISLVAYEGTSIETEVRAGTSAAGVARGSGGHSLRVSADVGYERSFGGRAAPLAIGALAGVRVEEYDMTPVYLDVGGGRLEPLLASHTAVGPRGHVRASWRRGALHVAGGAGAVFGGSFRETPANTSGKDPVPGIAPFLYAGAGWAGSRLTLNLSGTAETMRVRFSGTPRVDRDTPRDEDLVLSDLQSLVSLTAAYVF